jgi:phosphate-selective porin OprO/OprP
LHATAGKFKVPVGLERLQSSNDLRFIERGLPTSLAPNRDLGVSIEGTIAAGALTYSIGYFNGVVDGGSSDGNDTPDVDDDAHGDWAARLFAQPLSHSRTAALRGLGIGIAATYGVTTGDTTTTLLPHYRTPGQQTFFRYRGAADTAPDALATFADGERLRIAPQLSYYFGAFGVLAEYVQAAQEVSRRTLAGTPRSERLVHDAWQLQLSWFVTGERESFGGVTPLRPLSPDEDAWGVFELALRIHELDVDDDAFAGGTDSFADPAAASSKALAYGIGLTWYFNQNLKLQLNYDVTQFAGGAANGDRDDERALFTRFAIGF